jgi:GT2 family glycosyltransferase
MHRLAYVVPTKDRPDDLRNLLDSIKKQTIRPDQMIIVDGSFPPIKFVLDEFKDINPVYVRVFPPSLAKQRNAGMAAIRDDITVAGYLDDDVVLEPIATEKMLAFWNQADKKVGGASFSSINQPNPTPNRFVNLFLIGDNHPGRLLKSGFQSQIPFLEQTTQTDWLYGGATLWRRNVINEFSYDEWFIGTGYLEDVDYSFRVGQKYKLFVIGDARVWHFSRPIPLKNHFTLGRHQVTNRTYFFTKMKTFSRPAFAWALTGQFLHNIMSSVRRKNTAGFHRAIGNLVGIFDIASSQLKQIPGHYK